MLDYLQKYQQVPKQLRDKISGPEAMAAIDQIEKDYGIDMATIVIRLMIKDIEYHNLEKFLLTEAGIKQDRIAPLLSEINSKVLFGVMAYLNPVKTEAPIIRNIKPATRSAHFYFSPEDEEEIRSIAQNIDMTNSEELEAGYDKKIINVMSKLNIVFSASFMADRFHQILKTYLRGIRDKIETELTLCKPFEAGGLSFDKDLAKKVIDYADQNINIEELKIEKNIQINANDFRDKLSELQSVGMRDIEYDLASELAKKEQAKPAADKAIPAKNEPDELDPFSVAQTPIPPPVQTRSVSEEKEVVLIPDKKEISAKEPVVVIKPLDTDHELMPPTPAISKNITYTFKPQFIKPEPAKPDVPEPKQDPAPEPIPEKIAFIRPPLSEGKVKMEDVKQVPIVMDPIDELKYLNLTNFRRISTNPDEAIVKIKLKIDLLYREKFSRGLEAVKAWRMSPVNRLYLLLGQICIENNSDIDSVIDSRKSQNLETLEKNEFEAIMDLNKGLRH